MKLLVVNPGGDVIGCYQVDFEGGADDVTTDDIVAEAKRFAIRDGLLDKFAAETASFRIVC